MAWALWVLGYPDQALHSIDEALTLAQELAHPFSLAYALDVAAILHQFRREVQAAHERAEAAIDSATEQGFAYFLAVGTMLRGWALAEQGQGEEGLAADAPGHSRLQATGAALSQPSSLVLLAEAYGHMGQPDEGLRALAEALARDGHHWRSGARRRSCIGSRGACCWQSVPETKRRQKPVFTRPSTWPASQQAKSLELRAAMSLARLWQRQGKRAEARELLAPVYGWFTEGFDTADLQEARALLEELT